MKICGKCGESKPQEQFAKDKNRKDGLTPWCKNCSSIAYKARAERLKARDSIELPDAATCSRCNVEKPISEFGKNRSEKRGHSRYCKYCARVMLLAHRYSIDVEEVESLFADNQCDICGDDDRLHVDHCHETGEVRGVLCRACNHGLGNFKDSQTLLRNAVDYLNKRL